jgi:hypothetical protein
MPKLAFRPDADGLLFTNSFTWDATERAVIAALSVQVTPAVVGLVAPDPILASIAAAAVATYVVLPSSQLPEDNMYGLCGGLAYSALDHWHAHMTLPRGATEKDEPARGTAGAPVRVMLWNRLIDSLISGRVLNRTLEWMLRLHIIPSFLGGGAKWLNDRTAEEWETLKSHINQGEPWPIGLVGDTPFAWSQHQILVYGYEDSGTTKVIYVYDPNVPHDYGDTDDTHYEFSFSSSGLNVAVQPQESSGIGMLKGFFCSNYSPVIPPSGLALAFGEFVRANDQTQVWLMTDGERFPVASPQELFQLGGSFAGVRQRGAFPSGAVSWPRDGAILKELLAPEVYIIQGGARFHIPDPTAMESFGGFGVVHPVPDGTLGQFQRLPKNGTLLREISDTKVYRIETGRKRWVTTPADLDPLGGFPTVRIVPDGALAGIPDGPMIPLPANQLAVSVRPYPLPIDKSVTITVTAVDSVTQAPVQGTVVINNFNADGMHVRIQFPTNTPRQLILHRGKATTDEAVRPYPDGSVSAPGYQTELLDMGFPI